MFTPSQYLLETLPLVGVDPNEFVERAKTTQWSTPAFLLKEFGVNFQTAACCLNTSFFPNRDIQTLQPGLVIQNGEQEMLVLDIDIEDVKLGEALPEEIGSILLAPTDICLPHVTLKEF